MGLAEQLGLDIRLRFVLAIGMLVALFAAIVITPRTIRKLRGAGIVGIDRHKPGNPEIPEMGGLALFLAFNIGVFTILGLGDIPGERQALILASLVVGAGALVTGVLDDLVELRQRFKAIIPFAFAIPLALFVPDNVVDIPILGPTDLGLWYVVLLVPLGVACASNGFNMLEGFNGLGAGLGIILAAALAFAMIATDALPGLFILLPLVGALGGFLLYNTYPAQILPGDSLTLTVGALLASSAILSGLEVLGAALFIPHVIEFFLKAAAGFDAESFATDLDDRGRLVHEGPIRSLTHIVMRTMRLSEPQLVILFWVLEAAYAGTVLLAYFLSANVVI